MAALSRSIAWLVGLPGRIKLYAAVGVIAVLLALAAINHFTQIGYQDALDDVQEQNQRAQTAADEAAARVERCFDRGGVYDQSTGECSR